MLVRGLGAAVAGAGIAGIRGIAAFGIAIIHSAESSFRAGISCPSTKVCPAQGGFIQIFRGNCFT